jgi:hypothetical protein
MAKWIWTLYSGEQGLWADILRNKYLRDKDLLTDAHRPGSHFWNAIQKIKHVFSLGAKHAVSNGKATIFWLDWWQGKGPLKDRFPGLFAIAADQDAMVAAVFPGNACRVAFCRELGFGERVEWDNLSRLVDGLTLSGAFLV